MPPHWCRPWVSPCRRLPYGYAGHRYAASRADRTISTAAAPPRATYRLQFNRDFTFRDAADLVPYLAQLGISHVYASPIMEARPGSTHGYDIVNHNRLNPEIGSEDEFRAFVAALHRHELGLVIDIVPNHMGVGGHDNAWWLDVLEWGRASPYAGYFDINWHAARPDLRGRVLLPVLGDQYGVVLEAGDIALRFDREEGSFSFWYFEHRFPLAPKCYAAILAEAGAGVAELARGLSARRLRGEAARSKVQALKQGLAAAAADRAVAGAIDAAVGRVAGTPGIPASFRRLHRLLDAQAYRLAYWRVAADEINYRRFFNINDLAALQMQMPALFAATHRLIFAMVERGDVQGLRIDHIDGLFDPAAYAARLRERLPQSCWIIVEKVLARYETLPDWSIDGSTGYDFANEVLGLFVDAEAEPAMTRLYRRLTGRSDDFDAILYACKRRIMRVNLSSEMNVLAQRFHWLSMRAWRTRDFTVNGMLGALEEVIAAFPVYRTYVSERGAGDDDRRYIGWAIAQAKKRTRAGDTSIFDFLHGVLTGDLEGRRARQTAMQFQQVTGPVMAKAAEDTAFYRYFRLLALNEVGGDPRRFGLSIAGFHHAMRERARHWPRAMIGTATHDTKRGEDARIRLAMLSEMPRVWGQHVARWLRFNRSRRSEVDGEAVPDRNVEYLFYQTLVGAWPPGLRADDAAAVQDLAERVGAFMIKAVREGKEESSWSNPNAAYEQALERFVVGALDATRPNAFLADFAGFIDSLARPAGIASLAQLVLKLTAPGVPDIYQGCETWDFSLVDPDNRRRPDWAERRRLLAVATAAPSAGTSEEWQDGRDKLFVTRRLLDLRKRHPELFAEADYLPLRVEGGGAGDHLCVFARQAGATMLVVAVPRLVYRLYRGADQPDWGTTALALPDGEWRDLFTGRSHPGGVRVRAAGLFADFPVAALLSAPERD